MFFNKIVNLSALGSKNFRKKALNFKVLFFFFSFFLLECFISSILVVPYQVLLYNSCIQLAMYISRHVRLD